MSCHAGIDIDAGLVDRDGHESRAGGEQRAAGTEIAGILDPCGITGIEQEHREPRERLLGAGGDHHLLGGTARAAGKAQVLGDGGAQRGMAGRLGRAKEVDLVAGAEPAPGKATPHRNGKEIERRVAGQERPRDVELPCPGQHRRECAGATSEADARRDPRRRGGRGPGRRAVPRAASR